VCEDLNLYDCNNYFCLDCSKRMTCLTRRCEYLTDDECESLPVDGKHCFFEWGIWLYGSREFHKL
jgi:hypothetical protein